MNSLEYLYLEALSQRSEINEHVAMLSHYSEACRHVTEVGTRGGNSTIALLCGRPRTLLSYDVHRYPSVELLEQAAREVGVRFEFHQENVLQTDIAATDLLFIDTLHTYDQMRSELTRHGNSARRYLIFHDTETYRDHGELPGSGGVWPAIVEFLRRSPWWSVCEHHTNNNGLTILEREAEKGVPAMMVESQEPGPRHLAEPGERKRPGVSAVVPVKGRLDLTRKCVAAIRRCLDTAEIEGEIIIVDSDDGSSREWCQGNDCRWVEYPTQGAFSYPHAVNRGIAAAAAEVVLVSNNDVVDVGCDFIARALERFAVSPLTALTSVGFQKERSDCLARPYAALWFAGFHYCVRKCAWNEIGGACEAMAGYGFDEIDTSVRLARAGHVVEILQDVPCHHLGNETFLSHRGLGTRSPIN